jgi:transcriptional regulator with XRE-family HTH domain
MPEADADQLRVIGEKIRTSRRAMLSVEAFAEASGVSVGQISRIENGTGNPSVESLLRVITALGYDMADILEPEVSDRTVVVRSDERRTFSSETTPYSIELILPTMSGDMSVTYCEEQPGEIRNADSTIDGDVLYFVIDGTMDIEKDGHTYRLGPGDALLVGFPHRNTVVGDTVVKTVQMFRVGGLMNE